VAASADFIHCDSRAVFFMVIRSPAHSSLRRRWFAASLLLACSALVVAACGGGGNDGGAPVISGPPVDGPAWLGFARDAQSAIATRDSNRIAWSTPLDPAAQHSAGGAVYAVNDAVLFAIAK
jgi:hypothetical protein